MNTEYSEIIIIASDHPGLTEDLLEDIINRSVSKSGHLRKVIISKTQYKDIVESNPNFKDPGHRNLVDKNRELPMRLKNKINGVMIIVI